jgi:hypothetical protein
MSQLDEIKAALAALGTPPERMVFLVPLGWTRKAVDEIMEKVTTVGEPAVNGPPPGGVEIWESRFVSKPTPLPARLLNLDPNSFRGYFIPDDKRSILHR